METRDIDQIIKALKKNPSLELSLTEAWQVYIKLEIQKAVEENRNQIVNIIREIVDLLKDNKIGTTEFYKKINKALK